MTNGSLRTELPDGHAPLETLIREAQPAAMEKGMTRIELPPDGRASVSVLGDSVATQYAETAEQMRGFAVSTTYLLMGLKKNWILEYWVPPQEGSSLHPGTTAQLDPPWPYMLFRPEIMLPSDSPVMIRGALTAAGRLERLTLLLPAEWPQTGLLFQAMSQWKFRPPLRNGQPQAMEVLLVIPQQAQE
jgi:hypothetical protein